LYTPVCARSHIEHEFAQRRPGEICVFVERVDAAAHEAALKAWLDGVYAPQRVP
jgi:hypothetical protein